MLSITFFYGKVSILGTVMFLVASLKEIGKAAVE